MLFFLLGFDDLAKRAYNAIYGIETSKSSRNNKNKALKSNTTSSSTEITSFSSSTNPLQSKSQNYSSNYSSNEDSVKYEGKQEMEGGGRYLSDSTTEQTISDVTLEDSASLTLDVVTNAEISPNTIIELSSNINSEI